MLINGTAIHNFHANLNGGLRVRASYFILRILVSARFQKKLHDLSVTFSRSLHERCAFTRRLATWRRIKRWEEEFKEERQIQSGYSSFEINTGLFEKNCTKRAVIKLYQNCDLRACACFEETLHNLKVAFFRGNTDCCAILNLASIEWVHR